MQSGNGAQFLKITLSSNHLATSSFPPPVIGIVPLTSHIHDYNHINLTLKLKF